MSLEINKKFTFSDRLISRVILVLSLSLSLSLSLKPGEIALSLSLSLTESETTIGGIPCNSNEALYVKSLR